MACDTAFRIVARRHLDALCAHEEGTKNRDPAALHQMRVALTHLRTAILFFSPMIDDAVRNEIRDELKWLNNELGAVRDLDVAVERIASFNKRHPKAPASTGVWNKKCLESHSQLARTLRSTRYQWLIEKISSWIEQGPWSTKPGKQAEAERATAIGFYAAQRLAEWEKKLLKRSRKVREMGTKKRHRLRILNKRLTCSIDSLEDLFADKRLSKQKIALKHLRKAQRSLGMLNDGARGQALAADLQKGGADLQFLGRKRRKRLLKEASKAYRTLKKNLT